MEALCVCLSLFSTQIKRTHRWLWVTYIIFHSQSGHACIQIILKKRDPSHSGEVNIWNKTEYCSSKASENHQGSTNISNMHAHSYCGSHCHVTIYFCSVVSISQSNVVSVCCWRSQTIVIRNGKILRILNKIQYLFHCRSSLVLQLLSMWPDHMWLTWEQLHWWFLLCSCNYWYKGQKEKISFRTCPFSSFNGFFFQCCLYFFVQKLNCQWQKTGQFVLKSMVQNLAWHPTGTLILIAVFM